MWLVVAVVVAAAAHPCAGNPILVPADKPSAEVALIAIRAFIVGSLDRSRFFA